MKCRLNPKSQQLQPVTRDATGISLSSEDLTDLARLLAAGQVLLASSKQAPVLARLKAAMTRMHIPVPAGL